jgi:hypothetical protein
MKVALFLVAIILHLGAFGFSDHHGPTPATRTIACTIVDAATGEALTGVLVSVEGTDLSIWSDEKGVFTIELPASVQSRVTCSLVSFETISLEFSALQDGAVLQLSEK